MSSTASFGNWPTLLQAIWQTGNMAPGKRGLGFGCGEEPLPSYLASKGCHITVTDLPPDDQRASGWATTAQLASLDKAYKEQFIDRPTYEERVDFRYVDMTAIPDDLRGYDFCWSICAFEHLGSIEKGVSFIENAMDVLVPGGVSIHTTEFNFMNDEETIDNWGTVLFQKRHFQEMARRLQAKGYEVAPLNFDVGNDPMDKFIDIPPFAQDWHFDQAEGLGIDRDTPCKAGPWTVSWPLVSASSPASPDLKCSEQSLGTRFCPTRS